MKSQHKFSRSQNVFKDQNSHQKANTTNIVNMIGFLETCAKMYTESQTTIIPELVSRTREWSGYPRLRLNPPFHCIVSFPMCLQRNPAVVTILQTLSWSQRPYEACGPSDQRCLETSEPWWSCRRMEACLLTLWLCCYSCAETHRKLTKTHGVKIEEQILALILRYRKNLAQADR